MTGPLAPQFAQVREALGWASQCDAISVAIGEGCGECEGCQAFAALSVIERHLQDMEKAAREVVLVEHISNATPDQNDELRRRGAALRAALSALDGEA